MALNIESLELFRKNKIQPTLLEVMGCERSIVNGLSDLAYLFDFTTIDKRENCLIVFYIHLLDLNLINPETKLNLMFTQFFKSDMNSSSLLILKHLHKIENHHQTIDQ
jgi:hypothetical protein